MPTRPATDLLRDLVSPLAVAAYAGWAAVLHQAGNQLAAVDPALGWTARGGALAFLAGFLVNMSCSTPALQRRELVGFSLMLCGALVLLLAGRSETGPILLVILAAALGARLPDRWLWPSVGAILLLFPAILVWRWGLPARPALTYALTFGSFVAFAALALRHAARAEALSEQLRETNSHLMATRSLLTETARDSERLSLARELHDVAGHTLTALKLNLRTLAREAGDQARPELLTSVRLADELLEDLRAVVRQLRVHDGIELDAAFRRLAEPLPRPQVDIRVAPDARVPSAAQAEALLRVAQEGLTNAARHGEAQRLLLSLSRNEAGLDLVLEDDGRVRWPLREGNGLGGMRERLASLGGTLALAPSAIGGLRLHAHLPLRSAA